MAKTNQSHHAAVTLFYQHRNQLHRFIQSRINNSEDATDLVQDVFLRMLEYSGEIVAETAKGLAFAIASNVINDYLRHLYVKTAANTQISSAQSCITNETEESIVGRDLESLERKNLDRMPPQRRLIYTLRIHEGKTTKEIADTLNISTRTAENHFYIGIREMRACFKAAI